MTKNEKTGKIEFTPEQLNQLLSDVIKDTLNTAAEKAKPKVNIDIEWSKHDINVNKESITNTFEETFNKFKV